MPSNLLLLLPLIGGYLFNHLLHFLKFRAQGQDGHRLIFEAAASGLLWLLPARFLVVKVTPHLSPDFCALWQSMAQGTRFIGTTIIAVTVAPVAAVFLNVLIGLFLLRRVPPATYGRYWRVIRWVPRAWKASRESSLNWAVRYSGNALQQIFNRAAREASKGVTVGLTMGNRRIYAAVVTRSPNLSRMDEYVSLLPIMSGHREDKTLQIKYTYAYPRPAPAAPAQGSVQTAPATPMHRSNPFSPEVSIEDVVEMSVPVSEIKSAHLLELADLKALLEQLMAKKARAARRSARRPKTIAEPSGSR